MDITKIKLKNGTSFDFENKLVEIINKTDSALSLKVFNSAHRENTGLEGNEIIIPLKDILTIQIDKSETNVTLTIILVAGIVIVAGGLIAMTVFLSQGFKMGN